MMKTYVLLLAVLFHNGCFQSTNNIKIQIKLYEKNFNSSLSLNKEDRILMNSWVAEFQLKRINVTTKYRVELAKHRDNCLKKTNSEWNECVHHHRKQTRRFHKDYIENESGCLTTTTVDDRDKINTVRQVEKEIKNWRKGYKYLLNTCRIENPDDMDAAEACLVQFMEKDNYNTVINRLIILKLQTMGRLYLHLDQSVTNLEECLKTQLSIYLEKLRSIMDVLNKCYEMKTKAKDNTE